MTPGDDAFPTLEPERVAVFDALDERRRLSAGDYLYREGDASYDFYVIRSGAVEILAGTESAGGRVIVRHGPGQFFAALAGCAATSLREQSGHLVIGLSDGTEVAGRAVITATGAPGLAELACGAWSSRRRTGHRAWVAAERGHRHRSNSGVVQHAPPAPFSDPDGGGR